MMMIISSTSLIFALQLLLFVQVPCNHHAFSIHNSNRIYTTTVSPQSASLLTTVLKVSSLQKIQLSSTAKDDDSGGGGWYDDYDDFVSNLNFEGGGWDNSGAAATTSTSASGANYSGGRGGSGRDRNSDYGNDGRGGRGRGGDRSSPRRSSSSSSSSSSSRSGFRDDYNHDYQRDTSRDSSPIPAETMPIIENLLASRLEYRKKRMFDEADGVRDELLNVHGVTVWDKDKTWSTGGGGGGGGGGNGGGRGDRNARFNDRFDSRGRGAGSRGRDSSGRGGGRTGGPRRENKFNEHGHDYSQVGGPINPSSCSLSESEIHDRIRSRMECKFARDFKTADRIEYELRQAGVSVHDGFKEWRADGDEQDESSSWGGRRSGDERRGGGGGGRFGGGPKSPKVYYQRGPGKDLSVEDIATINALVAERSEAKSTMDYNRADEIFDQLTNEYNVNIDDKSGEWALLHEEYQLNANESAFVPDEKVQAMIGKKLGDRILARKARNFDLADDIREELINDYVVEIDDKAKEWLVVAPRGGQWSLKDGDDDDDDDHEANIVSKQEWDEEENIEEDGEDDDMNVWTEIDDDDDDDYDDSVGVSEGDDDSTDSDIGNLPTSSSLNESALVAMTVPELKEKLREAGLPLSGKKSELISRLLES